MADNYLEKRYEEVFGAGRKVASGIRRQSPSLDSLLVKNRSIRKYRQDCAVPEEVLRKIVSVNERLASAMNRQVLRFLIVNGGESAERLRELIFREGQRPVAPNAFIVVFSTIPEERYVEIDLGISLQTMALKAVELGYNCLIKGNVDGARLLEFYKAVRGGGTSGAKGSRGLPMCGAVETKEIPVATDKPAGDAQAELYPLSVLCVGKGDESVFLMPVESGKAADLLPYTKDGVHYVPKLRTEDLLL